MADLDLFGNPIPESAPLPPVYDKKPLPTKPVITVISPPPADTPHRPYDIIRESKTSVWLINK